MKTYQIFLKELTRPKIDKPKFWDYFSNDEKLRFDLFQQYLSTKPKPDLQLYLDRHLPNDNGNARDQPIPKLSDEFYELMRTDKMPPEYYSHTIEYTEIYKSLDSVFTGIEDFKRDAFKPEFERQDTVDFLKDIIRLLEGIKTSISASRILQEFINDKENIWLQSHLILGSKNEFEREYQISYKDAEKKYRKLKKQANNHLTDYLDNIENEPKQETKKNNTAELKDFFSDEIKADTVNAIQDKFKSYPDKKLAILINLLNQEYKYLKIDNNDRKKFSRIHFVRSLKKDPDIKTISGINNYIEGSTGNLARITNKDTAYLSVEKELKKMISSV